MAKRSYSNRAKIVKVESTSEKLSSRGGLFLFLGYVENIGFVFSFSKSLADVKHSVKGLIIAQFIKQILAFFIDSYHLSMTGFDRHKKDDAYQLLLENTQEEMASSHQIKRFLQRLIYIPTLVYRTILLHLFV